MKNTESLIHTQSKTLLISIVSALCVVACGLILMQPGVAQAAESEMDTVAQNAAELTNGNDSVIKATESTDTANADVKQDEASKADSASAATDTKTEAASTTTPAATETPKEDPNKYLKDASGKVITGAGWHSQGGKWYYTNAAGEIQKGLQTIKGAQYYLDPTTGVMLTGWQNASNNRYFFSNSGAAAKGWQKIGGKWYYLNPTTGIMASEFTKIGNKTYYLGAANDGTMRTGWQKIMKDGKANWYFFGGANDGAMRTGWQKLSGKWYYLNPSTGAMETGLTKVGNKTYYLGGTEDGSMKSSWQKLDNKWYYFGAANDGAMRTGWQKLSGKWYYLDAKQQGAMATGIQEIDKKTYYLGGAEDGSMKSGWQKLDNKWYYFGGANDGAKKTGWVKGAYWYYLDPANNGIMVEEDKIMNIGGTEYSFTSTGAMRSNAQIKRADNECWYAASSGALSKIGVFQDKDVLLKPADRVLTGWQKIAGTWFYANGSGLMQTGWLKQGATWYYLQPSSGAMATGSAKVGNETHYFEANGAWNEEKTNMVKRAQGFSSRTNYLVLVDVNKCRVGVFSGSKGNWSLIRYEACVCGAPGTPTIRGTYATGYHLGNLPKYPNALHCTNISGGYFFHSILNSTSELGGHLSHGCVRLNWPYAQYIQTLPYGSTVNLY